MFAKPLVIGFVVVATCGGLFGGPDLGDHEAIVAQAARDMRLTGDWLVPRLFDSPFLRKPPLPVWLVAGASYAFPSDPRTGVPVTETAARLPSALAAFGTVLLLWHFAAASFGRRTGCVTAIVAASSVGILLYAPNATAEMLLTFCCTWAFVHFWHAVNFRAPSRRAVHALLFYVALGAGMMAKGPAPIPLVCVPLATWWYAHRPLRVLSRKFDRRVLRRAAALFLRDLRPRTAGVFTQLWLFPGLLIFLALFVPWMLAVAARYPYAWAFWDWHYLQRADGDFGESGERNFFYYLPVLGGLVLPWTIFVFEAAVAPWVRRHARRHHPLLYAGLWTLIATLVMSQFEFKKAYYVLPAAPGLVVLIAFVVDWLLDRNTVGPAASRLILAGLMLTVCAVPVAAVVSIREEQIVMPQHFWIIVAAAMVFPLLAWGTHRRGYTRLSLVLLAGCTVGAFYTTWYRFGATVDNVDKVAALDAALDAEGVSPNAPIIWADRRPDARLAFYFHWRSRQLIAPEEVLRIAADVDRPMEERQVLAQLAIDRVVKLLNSDQDTYLIVEYENFQRWQHVVQPWCTVVQRISVGKSPSPQDWTIISNVTVKKRSSTF